MSHIKVSHIKDWRYKSKCVRFVPGNTRIGNLVLVVLCCKSV